MGVLVEVDTVRTLLANGPNGDEEAEYDGHSSRSHEVAVHTCGEEDSNHGDEDRAEVADAFRACHACAFRALDAYAPHMDPEHVVVACLRLLPRRRPSPQGSCRCAYLPHARSTVSLP